MPTIQNRRRFLATLCVRRCCGPPGQPKFGCPRGPAGNHDRSTFEDRRHLHRASICCRGVAAFGRVCRCPIRGVGRGSRPIESDCAWRGRLQLELCGTLAIPIDAGDAISIIAGVHSASNYSETNAFAVSRISRARQWGCKAWVGPHTSSWPPWPPMSDLTLSRTSTGSQVHQSRQRSFLPRQAVQLRQQQRDRNRRHCGRRQVRIAQRRS